MVANDVLRILVVEDEPDVQDIFAELLPYFDLAADAAFNANEALRLPATRDLPCVAVTAWHGSVTRLDALAAGFDAYFSKPFVPETFVHELRQVIVELTR